MKRIREYPNYAITKDGKVWSYIRHRFLKPMLNRRGYLQVGLYKNNVRRMITIHQLVAKNFIYNKDNLTFVNHKDSNKQNNNFKNLEWCSARDNNIHTLRSGRNQPKLTKEVVYRIRQEAITTQLSFNALGRKYGVSGVMIARIIRRLSWDYV